MIPIKHSNRSYLVLCTSTHQITGETKVIYATSYDAEHDAINTLVHVIDNVKVTSGDGVVSDDGFIFKVGLHRYVLTVVVTDPAKPISHAVAIADAVAINKGQWPSDED